MKIKKRLIFASLCFTLVFVLSLCCLYVFNTPAERLSERQIAELRVQYPICGTKIPAGLSMRNTTLNEVKLMAESFVYGEVVGDYSTYSVAPSTGNQALDDKRKANGINDVFEFYEYTISVIDDTEGRYTKGEQITITANTDFMDYNPRLSDKMKVVVPVVRDENKASRNHYTVSGMYYVTDDGYALSAFKEDTLSRSALNGIKVEKLLKELKK